MNATMTRPESETAAPRTEARPAAIRLDGINKVYRTE